MTVRTATRLSLAQLAAGVCLLALPPAGLSHDITRRSHPATTRCRLTRRSDTDAQQLALVAVTAIEVIATEHDGSYTRVSPMTIHHTEPTIPITRRIGSDSGAYLLSASGRAASYAVTVRASDGSTFSLRSNNGRITRLARECGQTRRW